MGAQPPLRSVDMNMRVCRPVPTRQTERSLAEKQHLICFATVAELGPIDGLIEVSQAGNSGGQGQFHLP